MRLRVKFIPLIVILAVGALALTMATGSQAGKGDIYGSDHDIGSAGSPTCAQCHTPHDAEGDYLWAKTPGGPLPESGALCFSCHDGSIAQSGTYIWGEDTVNHLMGPETHMDNYGDSYCTSCHDAHDGTWRFTKDVMGEGKPPNPYNAQVCLSCHGLPYFDPSADINHPWVTTVTSPLPVDQTFDPGAEIPDLSGTRLWDTASLQEPVAAGVAGDIACLSCHAVHGAASPNDTLNSMDIYEEVNVGTELDPDIEYHEPICDNCHQ